MNKIWKTISYVGLLATVIPSILVFTGTVELDTHKIVMVAGMILWFVTAPIWMNRKES